MVSTKVTPTQEESTESPPTENTNTSSNRWSFLKKAKKNLLLSSSPSHTEPQVKSSLLEQLLSHVSTEDDKLPKLITDLLQKLLHRGRGTEGVFRKAGNGKHLKEIKRKLSDGQEVNLQAESVLLLAALVKDLLRELPGGLLVTDLYQSWMLALEKENRQEQCSELIIVTEKLPRPYSLLLKHLLCVLHHISRKTAVNRMDSHNLAVCIAPSLLHRDNSVSDVEQVTVLTQFLIEHCCEIFGEDVLNLLGDVEEEAESTGLLSCTQHDSAYDSTDPEADGDVGHTSQHSGSCVTPSRRCSDPSTTQTRSQEDRLSSDECFSSSLCSIHSSTSNVSESSVFSSPPQMRRHPPEKPLRCQSWGSFSMRRGETQKELLVPCQTLLEDSQNETHALLAPARRRPLSAVLVFQQVDSRAAGQPPSYAQATQSMSVQDAWTLHRTHTHTGSVNTHWQVPYQPAFRPRAMSESVSWSSQEKPAQRCSVPVSELVYWAKESYV